MTNGFLRKETNSLTVSELTQYFSILSGIKQIIKQPGASFIITNFIKA